MTYMVTILAPVGDDEYWVLRDYGLAYALGVEWNTDAEKIVEEKLAEQNQALFQRVEFDSEMGCFFAYAKSEHDAGELAVFIAGLVTAGPHPDAMPGATMLDSPVSAALRDPSRELKERE
jgi:hypothetical protein